MRQNPLCVHADGVKWLRKGCPLPYPVQMHSVYHLPTPKWDSLRLAPIINCACLLPVLRCSLAMQTSHLLNIILLPVICSIYWYSSQRETAETAYRRCTASSSPHFHMLPARKTIPELIPRALLPSARLPP